MAETTNFTVQLRDNAGVTSTQALVLTIVAPRYTVMPSTGANGTISPNAPQSVTRDSTTQFTVTADIGYKALVSGTCGGTLSGNTYTTNGITADCTIAATFAADTDGDGTPDAFDLDDDNDGLPDTYENQYTFLDSLKASDAGLDYDRDGLPTKFEYDNNLDPTDGICPAWVCGGRGSWRHAIPLKRR